MNESTKNLIKSKYLVVLVVAIFLLGFLMLIAYINTANKNNGSKNSNNSSTNVNNSSNSVDAYFAEKNLKIQIGNEYEVNLAVKTKDDTVIQGYEANLTFDKSNIFITNISVVTGTSSVTLSDTNSNLATVNSNGSIRLLSEVQSATGLTLNANAETVLVKIKFKALTANASKIALAASPSSNLFVVGSDNKISTSAFVPVSGVDLYP